MMKACPNAFFELPIVPGHDDMWNEFVMAAKTSKYAARTIMLHKALLPRADNEAGGIAFANNFARGISVAQSATSVGIARGPLRCPLLIPPPTSPPR